MAPRQIDSSILDEHRGTVFRGPGYTIVINDAVLDGRWPASNPTVERIAKEWRARRDAEHVKEGRL